MVFVCAHLFVGFYAGDHAHVVASCVDVVFRAAEGEEHMMFALWWLLCCGYELPRRGFYAAVASVVACYLLFFAIGVQVGHVSIKFLDVCYRSLHLVQASCARLVWKAVLQRFVLLFCYRLRYQMLSTSPMFTYLLRFSTFMMTILYVRRQRETRLLRCKVVIMKNHFWRIDQYFASAVGIRRDRGRVRY